MASAVKERVHNLLTEGIAAVRAQEWKRAREILTEVVAEDPRSEHGYLWLAAIAESPESGMQLLARVLEINPWNEQAIQAMASLRLRTNAALPESVKNRQLPRVPQGENSLDSGAWRKPLVSDSGSFASRAFDSGRYATGPYDSGRFASGSLAGGPFERPSASGSGSFRAPEPVGEICPFCSGRVARDIPRCERCRAICSMDNIQDLANSGDIEDALIERCVAHWEDMAERANSAEFHRLAALGCFNLSRSADAFLHLKAAQQIEPGNREIAKTLDQLKDRKLVLVIDDSGTVRRLTSVLLDRNGFLTAVAPTAAAGFDWMKRARPDVIFLDLTLPDLDGLDVIRKIRSTAEISDIPVLAVSSLHGFFPKMKAKVAGCSAFLTKPFDVRDLLHEIRGLTGLKQDRNAKPAA